MYADPQHVENVVRTLLVGAAPDLRVQLDPKSQKLTVWGRNAQHQAIQAIIGEMERGASPPEDQLAKLDVQQAMTSIIQIYGGDQNGKTPTNGLRISADQINQTITVMPTPALMEQIKGWLMQMGELGGQGPSRFAGLPKTAPWSAFFR